MTQEHRTESAIAARIPAVAWIRAYRPPWLRSDLLAAAAVWALVVPQGIAYAQIAGLPPQAGLFATAAGAVAYAVLGTSRQLVVSPTSSTAAISAALVAPLAMGDAGRAAALSALLAILCGLALIVFGVLRMGFVSRFISAAVQAGFMFGLGLTIIVGQLPKLLGTPGSTGDFIAQAGGLLPALEEINAWTVAIGFGALAALLLLRRVAPGLPAALIVIVAGIGAVIAFDLPDRGVAVLGTVDGGFPLPAIPDVGLSDIGALLPGALIIGVIAYAEGITVAERFGETHRYEVRPDQELIAAGSSNVLSGLFQGFVVGGGASQSAANDRAGGKSQLVSLVVAALTVVTVIALLPLFQNLPQAVLGAIVVNAVLGFLDVPALRRIGHLRPDALVLAFVAMGGVLLLGVLPGLVIAVAISIAVYLSRMARPTGSVLGRTRDGTIVAVEHDPDATVDPAVLVYRLNATLVTVNAKHLRNLLREELHARDPRPSAVVLDFAYTPELDVGSIDALEGLNRELAEEGVRLVLGNVHADVLEMLRRSGLAEAIGEEQIHRTLNEAVRKQVS